MTTYDPDGLRDALLRIEAESTAPPNGTPLCELLAGWGARGFVAGCIVGFMFLAMCVILGGGVSEKGLLAFPVVMGILAIPGTVVGMIVGLLIWQFRRIETDRHNAQPVFRRPHADPGD